MQPGDTQAELAINGVVMSVKQKGPAAPPIDYVPVAVGELSQRHGFSDETCWGCLHLTKPARKDIDSEIWQLLEHVHQNQFTLTEKAFAAHLAHVHKELVVDPRRAEGEEVLEWPEHMIRVHFSHHVLNKRAIFMRQMQIYHTMVHELSLRVMRKNPDTGKEEPNFEVMTELRANTKILNGLLMTDMEKLGDL